MQTRRTIHSLLAILMITSTLVACQNENISDIDDNAKTGRIVLNLQDVEVFTEVTTRATGNVADYNYTLNKLDADNNIVSSNPITFDNNNSAIVAADKYSLTATSTTTQDAAPWYQGTSAAFTLSVGGTESISIDLGKPKNAAIAVTFAESFTDLYEGYTITIGQKSLTADGTLYAAVPDTKELTYTIHGSAKQDSHVSDIPEAGITGTLTVAAGTSYPLHITANTISDTMIGFGQGEHNGSFDVKRK